MQLIKSTLAIAVTTSLLTACGGGSGSTTASQPAAPATTASASSAPATTASQPNAPATTTTTPPTNTTPATVPLFNPDTTQLPNPSYLYPQECFGVQSLNIMSVEINNDSYKDFVVQYKCPKAFSEGIWEFGSYQEGAMHNVLVAYLSDEQGEYHIANQEVFGEALPTLDGGIHGIDYGDINGDGKTDILLGLANEDGRRNDFDNIYTNGSATHTVLMSTPTGLDVHKFGTLDWNNFEVQIVDNTVTISGFLTANHMATGIHDQAHQTYSYENGEWVDITEQLPFISPKAFHRTSEYIVSAEQYMKETSPGVHEAVSGIQLYMKVDGEWKMVDDALPLVKYGTFSFEGWNNTDTGQYFEAPLYELDGDKLIDSAWYGAEPITVNGEELIIIQYSGSDNREGHIRDGDVLNDRLDELGLNSLPPYAKYLFYRVNTETQKLEKVDIDIQDLNSKHNANYWEVKDVNSDGLDDLVRYPMSQKWRYDAGEHDELLMGVPAMYIQNDDNQFTRLDTTNYPYPSVMDERSELMGHVTDVDGNGTQDMVIFSTNPVIHEAWKTPIGSVDAHVFEIFYTNRALEEINE